MRSIDFPAHVRDDEVYLIDFLAHTLHDMRGVRCEQGVSHVCSSLDDVRCNMECGQRAQTDYRAL